MAHHLQETHGRPFDLDRDVSFAGNTRPDALLTYEAASPARGARFWCADCPGNVFSLEEPQYGSPERNSWLRLRDPGLRDALASVPAGDHERFTESWDREHIGAAALAAAEGRERMRVSRRSSPAYLRRLAGATRYLLEAYERLGNRDEAIEELASLCDGDPERSREVLGDARPYSHETIRTWWRQIPPAEREAAKNRYLQRIEG